MPRNECPGAALRSRPRERAAARPSGMMPSPQALSMGGTRESATVTARPRRRAARAAARPAGPPPITKRSVELVRDVICTAELEIYHTADQSEGLTPEGV